VFVGAGRVDAGLMAKTGDEVIAAIFGGESRPEKQAVTTARLITIDISKIKMMINRMTFTFR
jgi:hypothetical protein